jgi:hypothetical protein
VIEIINNFTRERLTNINNAGHAGKAHGRDSCLEKYIRSPENNSVDFRA